MHLYIHRDGQQYGPYSTDEARAHLASGALLPDDLAWSEGATAWIPLARVAGIAPSPAPAASARRPPPMARPAQVPLAVPVQAAPVDAGPRRRRRSSPIDALKRKRRSAGFRSMAVGAVVFLLGAGATIASYEFAATSGGGIYFIKYGAILFGALQFLKGAVQVWKA